MPEYMQPDTKKYIIYAEDDPDYQIFLKDALQQIRTDLDLVTVGNGLELVQYLADLKDKDPYPCFIILDMNMPVWDGIRTLQALKKEEDWKDIPVVMFTTSAEKKDADLSLRLGADQFITKPVKKQELKSISENFVSFCIKQTDRRKIIA